MLKRTPKRQIKKRAKRPQWVDHFFGAPAAPKQRGDSPAPLPDSDYSGPLGDENIEFIDRAFWLHDYHTPREIAALAPWLEAFEAINRRGDHGPLIALLRSPRELSSVARGYLADLLQHHEIKKKHGAPATPSYDVTDADVVLLWASQDVRKLVLDGRSVEEAVEQISAERGIPFNILKSSYRRSRASTYHYPRKRRLP
jgi:hypothetical protein